MKNVNRIVPRWSRWWLERKNCGEKNKGLIHIYVTDNKKETNLDTLNAVMEEWPDDTTPVEMEICVNDEDDDEKEKNSREKKEGVIHRDITDN